ncbi:pyrimidine dimer DNA glycosylase/endonuclease V [Falsarthrobacter nasiphocae]|uniref:DNA lyase n=1 Tax=Falsarthrobacter nasiphocae TaxID=189863 RepID=A0AAE4C898_9MICC|nr:pyrimidine dimer DNA glycosylase/endonuclease V [Falsarthrobacter nasiphocae]MDR6892180.1 hypothetical protein [Falsarthrobacter nasiphocae]
MRLWSLHPSLLDRQALVAGWREALLAQKVLQGLTRGYTRHPQLERFRAAPDPLACITAYLHGLADEADSRGYRFDRSRIAPSPEGPTTTGPALALPVTEGQLDYELRLLKTKVRERSPEWEPVLDTDPAPHPLFRSVAGGIESWERVKPELGAPSSRREPPHEID